MRLPLACAFAALALFASPAADGGAPSPICPTPLPAYYILYSGPVSHCTPSAGPCAMAEPVAFSLDPLSAFLCTTHTCTWSFGDASTSTQLSPTHAYASPGTYTVTLAMLDLGSCPFVVTQVHVAAPAPATSPRTLALLALALAIAGGARLFAR
jgi:PKD domain